MIDYLCRSEGELTLLEIAKAIESGNPFNEVKGATYQINGEIVETERIGEYEEL